MNDPEYLFRYAPVDLYGYFSRMLSDSLGGQVVKKLNAYSKLFTPAINAIAGVTLLDDPGSQAATVHFVDITVSNDLPGTAVVDLVVTDVAGTAFTFSASSVLAGFPLVLEKVVCKKIVCNTTTGGTGRINFQIKGFQGAL